MNLTLPSEIERLLKEKVENGEFESVEAAVTHTLRQSLVVRAPGENEAQETASPDNIWEALARRGTYQRCSPQADGS